MKKYTANDGTFWVSTVTTKEGKNIAFCYAWETATDDLSEKISNKFPNYFELESGNDLWLTPISDINISLEELKEVASMDTIDSIVIADMDTKEVIAGVKDWLDFNSFRPI